MWCLQWEKNHQWLLWNVHCVPTVVLSKQLNFKSAVIRSNRSSCFFSFVGEQTLTSTRPNFEWRNLWCLLAKSCWNINTRNVTETILFALGKIYFLLVLSKRWIRREIINTLKKRYYDSHGMRWRCSFHFRYVTNKIEFTLQVYFGRSDGN